MEITLKIIKLDVIFPNSCKLLGAEGNEKNFGKGQKIISKKVANGKTNDIYCAKF